MSRPGNAFEGEKNKEGSMPYKGRQWGKEKVDKKVPPKKKSSKKK